MISRDVRVRSIVLTLLLVATIATIVSFRPEPPVTEPTSAPPEEAGDKGPVSRHFDWATQQLRSGQFELALNGFRAVLEQAPTMPEAHVNKGFAHIGLEQFEEAAQAFETAIDLRPEQVNAYWGLAVSLEGVCDIPGAMGAMRTYVHLAQPDDPFITRANAALWEWEQLKSSAKAGDKAAVECAQVDEPAD